MPTKAPGSVRTTPGPGHGSAAAGRPPGVSWSSSAGSETGVAVTCHTPRVIRATT